MRCWLTLIAVPTLSVSQWMLGYAGWFDSHDRHSTVMFCVLWHVGTALGPGYCLCFRSLTNQKFRWWPLVRHLLPTLLKTGLFAASAAYDLLWCRALHHRPLPDFFGTKGALALPLALLGHALLLVYGLRMLADYRRYLDDNFSNPERLRLVCLRQLLVLTLGLLYTALNTAFEFSYDAAWNFFALRGIPIYELIVVGIQAKYAVATSPLRLEPGVVPKQVPKAVEASLEVSAAGAAVPEPLARAPWWCLKSQLMLPGPCLPCCPPNCCRCARSCWS